MELRGTYDADVGTSKEKLQRSEKRADRLYAWAALKSNRHKKDIGNLEKANALLRKKITKLTAKVDSERLMVQQDLQKKLRNTAAQAKTVAQLRRTIRSLNTNVELPSSEIEVLQKFRNDDEFMRYGTKAQKALLAAHNSKLAQQLAEVQKSVTTICKSLPEVCSK